MEHAASDLAPYKLSKQRSKALPSNNTANNVDLEAAKKMVEMDTGDDDDTVVAQEASADIRKRVTTSLLTQISKS